jgi:hypothetical protein
MAVIAEPQELSNLVCKNQVASLEGITKDKANESLMSKITNILYPAWVIRMGENCYRYEQKAINARLFHGF